MLVTCRARALLHGLSLSCAAAAAAVTATATTSASRSLCRQFENATTASGRYTFLTDQWGLDSSGFQCMNVSLDDKNPTNSTSFSATWQWAGTGANATTVHAFPNVNLNSPSLPLQLGHLQALQLTASWALGPDTVPLATSPSDLSDVAAVADVALDMFLDVNPTKAQSATEAAWEIMIWQAAYGGVRPIGWADVTADAPTVRLKGETYTLSHGLNGVNQSVYSWLPSRNLTSVDADLSPLIHYLWRAEYLPSSALLGLVQWGSEAVHSAQGHNVTFLAETVALAVEAGMPKASRGAVARQDRLLTWAVASALFLLGVYC